MRSYLFQIPVIMELLISKQNIFASSLKIILILLKNCISYKTSHLQLTFNYIFIRDRYEKLSLFQAFIIHCYIVNELMPEVHPH